MPSAQQSLFALCAQMPSSAERVENATDTNYFINLLFGDTRTRLLVCFL